MSGLTTCPRCGGEVAAGVTKCKYCNLNLVEDDHRVGAAQAIVATVVGIEPTPLPVAQKAAESSKRTLPVALGLASEIGAAQEAAEHGERTCPHCGGGIRAAARLCKHCRKPVAAARPMPEAAVSKNEGLEAAWRLAAARPMPEARTLATTNRASGTMAVAGVIGLWNLGSSIPQMHDVIAAMYQFTARTYATYAAAGSSDGASCPCSCASQAACT